MDGIVKMHYAENMNTYYKLKDEVLADWKKVPQSKEFTKYFSEEWLDGRYWRWQVFHTPVGYATTNNPPMRDFQCDPEKVHRKTQILHAAPPHRHNDRDSRFIAATPDARHQNLSADNSNW
ncbi:hypothetical protein PR001_g18692 [Phytophthora rubi]|uniref:Uncharacterized protein n=1 Tax=Phytophthora rubi TaxID=129364 RepID=A0A6A3K133_9STRA|nr:hypothetical protein PR001_g18692 [Phytophthora rubi]